MKNYLPLTILVLLSALILTNCDNTLNISEDYFPLNNTHFYLTRDNDSILIKITPDDTNINGLIVSSIYIDTLKFYVYKDNSGVYKIDTLGNGSIFIPLPLINNTTLTRTYGNYSIQIRILKENQNYTINYEENSTSNKSVKYTFKLAPNKGIIEWNGYSR